MSSDEVRLRPSYNGTGGYMPHDGGDSPVYIALPLARHAALMRVVEAARALLDLLAYEHPDFGYSEIADLRAALAAPEPAQAGEAVACAVRETALVNFNTPQEYDVACAQRAACEMAALNCIDAMRPGGAS